MVVDVLLLLFLKKSIIGKLIRFNWVVYGSLQSRRRLPRGIRLISDKCSIHLISPNESWWFGFTTVVSNSFTRSFIRRSIYPTGEEEECRIPGSLVQREGDRRAGIHPDNNSHYHLITINLSWIGNRWIRIRIGTAAHWAICNNWQLFNPPPSFLC